MAVTVVETFRVYEVSVGGLTRRYTCGRLHHFHHVIKRSHVRYNFEKQEIQSERTIE